MRGGAAPGGRLPGLCRDDHPPRTARPSHQENRSRPPESGPGLVPARAPGESAAGRIAPRRPSQGTRTRATRSGPGAACDAPADAHADAARANPRHRPGPRWSDASAGVARAHPAQQCDLALRHTGSSSARAGRGPAPTGSSDGAAAIGDARPRQDGDRQWLRLGGTRKPRGSGTATVRPSATGRAKSCATCSGPPATQPAADATPMVAEPHAPVRHPHAGDGDALRAAPLARGSPRGTTAG